MRNRIPFVLIALFRVGRHGEREIPHLEKPGRRDATDRRRQALLALAGRNGQHRLFRPRVYGTAWPKIVKANPQHRPGGYWVGTGWSPWKASTTSASSMTGSTAARKHDLAPHIPVGSAVGRTASSASRREWVKPTSSGSARPPQKRQARGSALDRSQASLDADTRAYTAFMHHLRKPTPAGATCS